MKCRRAKKLIFDYIDGMISDQDRIGLERHIGECTACEAMATGLNKSLDLLHRVPPVKPDENFNWKLRLRLARERNGLRADAGSERLWFKWWNTRFALSALSTFVLVVAAGFFLIRSGVGPSTGPMTTSDQGLRFDEMPKVAANTPTSGTRPSTPTTRGAPPAVPWFSFQGGPRFVSSGSPVAGRTSSTGKQTLDVDSLMARYLQTRRETYRIRQLEQQVELLQSELEKCDADSGRK
ncbi:MAG: zf-HC2 domain-containing protein [Candidatus Latescibacterota bacterium]|nr:MAG: zf-HC2 domain-containing protein [Candidatus Latescibacterota bacterium]